MRADQTSPPRSRQLSNEKPFKDQEENTSNYVALVMKTNQSRAEGSGARLEQSRVGQSSGTDWVQRRNRISQMECAQETNVVRMLTALEVLRKQGLALKRSKSQSTVDPMDGRLKPGRKEQLEDD
ncbi:hypothetical protein B0H10DRAFT_1947129 [Mycena sp. CBHHK59/15]|nr:hypothetical protein B0H10DRAFT_1947129 [Mycena sp. CBHHK59/15]